MMSPVGLAPYVSAAKPLVQLDATQQNPSQRNIVPKKAREPVLVLQAAQVIFGISKGIDVIN
jgi:hypothetical protein